MYVMRDHMLCIAHSLRKYIEDPRLYILIISCRILDASNQNTIQFIQNSYQINLDNLLI